MTGSAVREYRFLIMSSLAKMWSANNDSRQDTSMTKGADRSVFEESMDPVFPILFFAKESK